MRRYLIKLACLSLSFPVFSQKNINDTPSTSPKLVVGIVVDQMRYDYLYRFYDKYTENGFKRLMNKGYNCRNTHYHYTSTVTGPGHAHVYTGSAPAISGIVGNEWYDKVQNKAFYVVQDSTVSLVGEGSPSTGRMSPRNLKVTTITDQLRIATQMQSKVVGVAFKDRGAILPAGHLGQAYWFDSSSSNWVTSSYYHPELPKWVYNFNAKKLASQYTSNPWKTLKPIESYSETEADNQNYEAVVSGDQSSSFPHHVKASNIAYSYYGNDLTTAFALAAFENENMGKGKYTDFLAISYSSTDYVGHFFGPQSKEIEDIYLRLDLNVAQILNRLDAELGSDNYTVFLTADHGVAEVPGFMLKNKIPAGLFLGGELKKMAENTLTEVYGEGSYILAENNYQLSMNQQTLKNKKISLDEVTSTLRRTLPSNEGIYEVVNLESGNYNYIPSYYFTKLQNLYHPRRSGELMILVEPAWMEGYTKGTTHGTMYAYDTHIPLVFYGNGFKTGETFSSTYISDIAPTLAQFLKILEPNGNIGKVIDQALK